MLANFYSVWFVAFAAVGLGSPVVVERLSQTPPTWREVGPVEPDRLIALSIGLEAESPNVLDRTLFQVSDPSHALYGRHLTRDQAQALVQPHEESIATVKRWLAEAGVENNHVREQGQLLYIHVAVEQAESLLATRFSVFARGGDEVVRTREYSVPTEVRRHITFIQPTTFFGYASAEHRNRASAKQTTRRTSHASLAPDPAELTTQNNQGVDLKMCKKKMTPACIRKLYKIAGNYPINHPKSLLGIAGFDGQAAQFAQLEKFLPVYAPYAVGTNFSVALVNGGENPQGEFPSGEANLDVQLAVALGYRVPVRYYATGGVNENFISDLDLPGTDMGGYTEPFLEFAQYFLNLNDDDLPKVLSISYGSNEQHYPKPYAKQVCNIFGQLGTRGVSVIVASGDTGPGVSCQSNDGGEKTKFLPVFPATCPYVTSVGGTESVGPEIALNLSSGGFSEYWSRPKWQDNVVQNYLKKHGSKWKGFYKPNGRAFPDVAAQGNHIPLFNHDTLQITGGTSASAPIFAAMIALINNQRFHKGKPAMGFLNPWIYGAGKTAFTDITTSKSEGCEGSSFLGIPSPVVPHAGWDAVPGWDPVTGLGTPLFDRLSSLAGV